MTKTTAVIIEDEIPAARMLMEMLKNLRPEWDIVTIPRYVEEAIPYFKGKIKLIIRPKYDKEIIISEHRSQLFRLWLNY